MRDETRFDELKRYVRFTDADAACLADFRKLAEPEFPAVAREFYDRIREHDEAHSVFTSEAQIEQLQRTLVTWLTRVCGGTYDEAYYEQTSNIGRVHVKIGLPQRYMLTAMSLVRTALLRVADRELQAAAAPTREALSRILDLELAIMLEAYKDSFVDRIRHIEKQKQQDLGKALARAEHRYVSAVEFAQVLIVGLDKHGCIQLFNREAERVTGYARDEVFGRHFTLALKLEAHSMVLRERLTHALSGMVPAQICEGPLLTRSGRSREVLWNLAYAGEQAGDDVVLFAIGQDLTDARAMEERTRQAERLAAIGTLAAGLAHEIRNPLNGAQLHIAFLERGIAKNFDAQEMLEATRVVGNELKRLAALVTEFLDFARPNPPQFKLVSLTKVFEQVTPLVAAQAQAHGVELRVDAPSVDVPFHADPAKLAQVLLNLLRNALEAIGPHGGTVSLRGRRGPRHVLIDIEDDGPGLSSAEAPIFDAFFSTKEGGTGLGLAITHRIVTDHRGTIDVTRRDGKTTFHVELPLEQPLGSRT